MKFSTILLSGLATLVSAQFPGEPACAVPCLSSAVLAIGCALSDVGCQCAPAGQSSLAVAAAGCLIASCPATQLVAIQSIGNALCLQYSAALTAATSLTTVTTTVPATPASTTTSTITSTTSTFPQLNSTSFANTTTVSSTKTSVIVTTAPPATTTAAVTSASPLSSLTSKAGAMGVAAGGIGGLAALMMGALAML